MPEARISDAMHNVVTTLVQNWEMTKDLFGLDLDDVAWNAGADAILKALCSLGAQAVMVVRRQGSLSYVVAGTQAAVATDFGAKHAAAGRLAAACNGTHRW